ncbi:MAG: hypothetical protein IM574_09315 [Cytophagales bacterium]|jgi:hypothetical protein|nr:hypothetical protein [Cytophagales bacterium]MCA6386413.1 hypothetical protein [Cytophagales bacterium]MCA6390077.1 hypothetical protein [Cytophagales bacterium]MCA6393870.1 hypothetical protein [Cytophagales bacterium]MCA6397339.1 hypothetical protein [Cytophagales bacterium]
MTPSPFISKLKPFFSIAEIVCVVGFVLGFLLKKQDYPIGGEIVMLSLSALAGIYFLSAYLPPDARPEGEPDQRLGFMSLLGRTIAPKVLGIGSAVVVIGILFTLNHFEGSKQMLTIGIATIGGASLVGSVSIATNENARRVLGSLLLRAFPLLLIGVYLLWNLPSDN